MLSRNKNQGHVVCIRYVLHLLTSSEKNVRSKDSNIIYPIYTWEWDNIRFISKMIIYFVLWDKLMLLICLPIYGLIIRVVLYWSLLDLEVECSIQPDDLRTIKNESLGPRWEPQSTFKIIILCWHFSMVSFWHYLSFEIVLLCWIFSFHCTSFLLHTSIS